MTTFEAIAAKMLNVNNDAVQMVVNGVNKNLRVKSAGRDVHIRFSPTSLHSREDLEAEVAFLAAINTQLDAACDVVVAADNNILGPAIVAGQEYNGLITFTIEGEQLTSSTDDAREFGRSLAIVHRTNVQISQSAGPSPSSPIEVPPLLSSVYNDLISLKSDLKAHITQPVIGVCHGDAWLGNAINRNGRAVLFDFEFWTRGPIAYDIGTFAWNLYGQSLANSAGIFASFVEGYKSVYDLKLTTQEILLGAVEREINNIHFMTQHISMSREIKIATAKMARDTIKFATLENPLFVWE
ncbi:hypothetical protein BMW22_35830 (plasmid) [Rhizobium leguminosarum]|uniref:Aminoglycoside phosphotransferase domain-containing protein n=1 Tax=Rhizobium leguminosarum TaxID=384 RepID=A0A1L3ZMC4_RHILE|nr:phosphotransferase [Rhizobium leguminosarum]API56786.1 hypothetical protein BMW22_35830 [Rhizobium leguminosarum]